MTPQTQVLPNRLPSVPSLYQQAAVTVLLAGWADWLFFGHRIGITFALFIGALAAAIVMVNRDNVEKTQLVKASGILTLALLPSLENLSYLSAGFGLFGIISFVLIVHRQFRTKAASALRSVCGFLLRIPARLPLDMRKVHKAAKRRKVASKQRLTSS